MVKIRAKSILKLDTGQSFLDYEYGPCASIDAISKDMLHAVVQNKGTEEAKKFFNALLDEYDADYKGLFASQQELNKRVNSNKAV